MKTHLPFLGVLRINCLLNERVKAFSFSLCLFIFLKQLLKDKIELEIGFQHSSIGCKCSGKKLFLHVADGVLPCI